MDPLLSVLSKPERRTDAYPDKRKGGRQFNHPQHIYDDIYRMLRSGEFTYRQIARNLGVSPGMVCQMAKRRAGGYAAPVSKPKMTKERLTVIEGLVSGGMTVREAAETVGVSYHSAECAMRRKIGKGAKELRG